MHAHIHMTKMPLDMSAQLCKQVIVVMFVGVFTPGQCASLLHSSQTTFSQGSYSPSCVSLRASIATLVSNQDP